MALAVESAGVAFAITGATEGTGEGEGVATPGSAATGAFVVGDG